MSTHFVYIVASVLSQLPTEQAKQVVQGQADLVLALNLRVQLKCVGMFGAQLLQH